MYSTEGEHSDIENDRVIIIPRANIGTASRESFKAKTEILKANFNIYIEC